MDLQTSNHYQLTIYRPGDAEPELFEVEYERREWHEDGEVLYFVGPNRFHVGIPDRLFGSDFEIEPI